MSFWPFVRAGFQLAVLLVLEIGGAMSASEVSNFDLPEHCDPPPQIRKAVNAGQSSDAFGAAGAWFAQQKNWSCSLPAFKISVQLDSRPCHSYYNVGLIQRDIQDEMQSS